MRYHIVKSSTEFPENCKTCTNALFSPRSSVVSVFVARLQQLSSWQSHQSISSQLADATRVGGHAPDILAQHFLHLPLLKHKNLLNLVLTPLNWVLCLRLRLVLSGLIVSEGLRKSSGNVTIFFRKISVSIRISPNL